MCGEKKQRTRGGHDMVGLASVRRVSVTFGRPPRHYAILYTADDTRRPSSGGGSLPWPSGVRIVGNNDKKEEE